MSDLELEARGELWRWNAMNAAEQAAETAKARSMMTPQQFLENVANLISSASSTTDDVYRDMVEFMRRQNEELFIARNPDGSAEEMLDKECES